MSGMRCMLVGGASNLGGTVGTPDLSPNDLQLNTTSTINFSANSVTFP